jgi:hypothetical protein
MSPSVLWFVLVVVGAARAPFPTHLRR